LQVNELRKSDQIAGICNPADVIVHCNRPRHLRPLPAKSACTWAAH
jgi:hypothetical protein